jgi:hypothetical protein
MGHAPNSQPQPMTIPPVGRLRHQVATRVLAGYQRAFAGGLDPSTIRYGNVLWVRID